MSDREDQLEARYKDLTEQIRRLQYERETIGRQLLSIRAPADAGDIIEFKRGGKVKRGRVTSIFSHYTGGDSVNYHVIPRKKDGSDGVPIKVYSFDFIRKVEDE